MVDELTIKETIFYFGRIYGMHDDRIRIRFKLLKDLLELPDSERMVMKLSGGQKRRVSFACALVHGKCCEMSLNVTFLGAQTCIHYFSFFSTQIF